MENNKETVHLTVSEKDKVPDNICPHCRKEIDPHATKCPHCQSKIRSKHDTRNLILTALGIVVGIPILIALAVSSGGNNNSNSSAVSTASTPNTICDQDQTALKKSAKQISYKQLSKDPTSFQGQIATFKGKVLQIQQSGNEGVMRLSVTNLGYGMWSPNDVLYITYHRPTSAVEDDIVSVTGQLTGVETYTSQANYQISIPSIDVCSVDISSTKSSTLIVPEKTNSTNSVAPATTQTNTTDTTTNAPKSWHTVQTFSGSDNTNTSPFTIRGSQWQIQWTATAQSNDSYCQQYGCTFAIQILDTTDNIQQDYILSNDITSTKSGSSYYYTPGQFYLKIGGGNMSNWTATVLDYY